jgi:hypothetical protein
MANLAYSFLIAVAVMLPGCVHHRTIDCPTSPQANGEIERTVTDFFAALRNEDRARFEHLTTASFYSFDNGKRFAGTELVDVVHNAHARGVELNWSIDHLDTKVRCDVAWSAWENIGSAGIPPNVQPVHWLESAVLVRDEKSWKIAFFHSQRAAAK